MITDGAYAVLGRRRMSIKVRLSVAYKIYAVKLHVNHNFSSYPAHRVRAIWLFFSDNEPLFFKVLQKATKLIFCVETGISRIKCSNSTQACVLFRSKYSRFES